MVFKAAVQILKKADDLKLKLSQRCDLLNDSEIWTCQQQLQTIYHQVLVLDLEYALDKKVEQELWALGFKNHITALQELARDKKNPKRSDAQALLSWCLEAASGFYLTLLQELCITFSLDLPFRRKGSIYGQIKECTSEQNTTPKSSSCVYICQYCLVHLGDIARYRSQRQQSESFYKQAILVSPISGHPYNQLALLDASQGNKLSTVFHYVRSIAVKNPFPAATTNLLNTLSSAVDKECPIMEKTTKLTLNEFIQLFLCVHGLLQTVTDLDQAHTGVKILNSALTALVATESFTAEKLLEMTAINFYALWHTVGLNVSKTNELTEDEIKVKELVLELLAGSLSAFLIPVHTLKADERLLEYYALPSVKFLLNWIQNSPEVLQEKVFSNRLQIWPSLCKLLNHTQPHLKEFNYDDYKNAPLPEDIDIRGFIPIDTFLKDIDFKTEEIDDANIINKIRVKRLIDFGIWVCGIDVNDKKLILMSANKDSEHVFEPVCIQPDPTESLLEEMRSVSLVESILPISKEKRGGILKPQGSLEKNREEREQVFLTEISDVNSTVNKDSSKVKRVRNNVALQSIFKKMEESKQVKFNVETTDKKEKPIKTETKINIANNANNQPLRTQTFNQNHPALTKELPNDLLTKQHVNVLPPLPAQKNLPQFPNMNQRGLQQNVFPQPLVSYQNTMQYPQYSPWKQEERQTGNAPPPSWWSNINQSYPTENYQQYSNSMSYLNPNEQFANLDYTNKTQNVGFSSWRQPIAFPGPAGSSVPYENQNQNLSMRQAMLKEAVNMPTFGSPGPVRPNTGQLEQPTVASPHLPNAGAYSLFNANSWNPNLPTHLKTPRNAHESFSPMQHSLFAGQGPQSLAQLLEQQNQWQKNDS